MGVGYIHLSTKHDGCILLFQWLRRHKQLQIEPQSIKATVDSYHPVSSRDLNVPKHFPYMEPEAD